MTDPSSTSYPSDSGEEAKETSMEEDDLFQCKLLSIRVENRIFRVPRELHELYSDVFKDMFSLPQSDNDLPDGERDNKPLVLEGIRKDDFRAFLTVLSSLHYTSMAKDGGEDTVMLYVIIARIPLYKVLQRQDRVAVLHLAHMWGFENVRQTAIYVLERDAEVIRNPLERLRLAHKFHIDDWVPQAYRELIIRLQSLSAEEVPWLSPDFVQNMAKAREERTKLFLARIISRDINAPTCPGCDSKGTLRLGFDTDVPTMQSFYLQCSGDYRTGNVFRAKRKYSLSHLMCHSVEIYAKGTLLITEDLDTII